MFIASKKNFLVRRPDGSTYRIKKDFVGNIPDDVAKSWLVQAAVNSGSIIAPQGTKDRELAQAETVAEQKAQAADIRPDAQETEAAGKKDEKKAPGSKK